MVSAIIAAAGQSRRMAGQNKQLLNLAGVPVIARSLRAIAACGQVGQLIIVTTAEQILTLEELIANMALPQPVCVVTGGSERQYSVFKALQAVSPAAKFILVHDGARPLVELQHVEAVIAAARQFQAAGLAVPVKDTIKVVDRDGFVVDTPERQLLWAMQTPQVFAAELLRSAYARAVSDGYLGTDDTSVVERAGAKVKLVKGSYENIKITTPEDVWLAAALLHQRQQ